MFYLKQFFVILIKNPLIGIVFSFVSFVLIFTVIERNEVDKKIQHQLQVKKGSFFYALIPTRENTARVARKLKAIPFVFKVDIMNKKQIEKQVKKTLKSLKFDDHLNEVNLNYEGIRVEYKAGLEMRSKKLIRDYLKRFVGEKKLILGGIKDPDYPLWKKSIIFKSIVNYGSELLISLILLLWLPIAAIFKKRIDAYAVLLEYYQRRKNLNLKISTSGAFIFFLLGYCLSL